MERVFAVVVGNTAGTVTSGGTLTVNPAVLTLGINFSQESLRPIR